MCWYRIFFNSLFRFLSFGFSRYLTWKHIQCLIRYIFWVLGRKGNRFIPPHCWLTVGLGNFCGNYIKIKRLQKNIKPKFPSEHIFISANAKSSPRAGHWEPQGGILGLLTSLTKTLYWKYPHCFYTHQLKIHIENPTIVHFCMLMHGSVCHSG